MFQDCLKYYKTLFYFFRSLGLDFSKPKIVFCIHHLFLQVINETLESFRISWNMHPLSTEKNRSPNQLLLMNTHLSASEFVDLNTYGVSDPDEDELDHEDDRLPQVNLQPLYCPLTPTQLNYYNVNVHPLLIEELEEDKPSRCLVCSI